MGLAPYGEPSLSRNKDKLLEIGDDGGLRMNHEYFSCHKLCMTNRAFDKLIGGPPRLSPHHST